jgi:hypothetical protein
VGGGTNGKLGAPMNTQGPSGRMTVLTENYGLGGERDIGVFRWDDEPATFLGNFHLIRSPSLALEATGGWVAHGFVNLADTSMPTGLFVRLYNGTQWDSPQKLVDLEAIGGTNGSVRMKIRFDYLGETVIAYSYFDGANYLVRVLRSTGSTWNQVGAGPALTLVGNSFWSLSIDPNGRPILSYVNGSDFGTVVWNGSAWDAPLTTGGWFPAGSNYQSLYTSTGLVFAAYRDVAGVLHVGRGNLVYIDDIGTPISGDGSLVEDSAGSPVVVWLEGELFCAKRWNGSAWVQLESNGTCTGVASAALSASPGGPHSLTVSACYTDQAYYQHVYCGRYNR